MAPKTTRKPGTGHHQREEHKRHDSGKAKERNAKGFQKRMAQKPPKSSDLLDVYEYDEKQKGRSRANVALDLSRDEAREFGIAEDEEDIGEMERIRQKLRLGDDIEIDSEDDEDIDSDNAFDKSDEERFAEYNLSSKGTKPKNSKKKRVRLEVDLNEEEDSPDGETTDDSAMEEGETDEEEWHGISNANYDDASTGSGSEEPVDDLLLSEDDGEVSQDALDTLETYIKELPTTSVNKRKAPDLESTDLIERPRRKRRLLKEQTEAGPEGEFGAPVKQNGKLQLSDLIAPLTSEDAPIAVQSLQSAAKALNGVKSAPLSAPLPLRTQDRLDRQAAYEQTKTEAQKWEPTMKRIREADHLSFPLQTQAIPKANVAALASDFKPATKLESAVDKLLKAAELRDQDIAKTEDLQMQHLTVEEIEQRRAELRKTRDLMFRAEIKAKRVAKIKSKAYRKIQKKQRGKEAEKLKELGLGPDAEEERMKAEVARAKERATLKHKSTGKWAMSMRERGEIDNDQRKAVQEMYDRGQRLRQKIQGMDDVEEQSEEDEEEEGDDVQATARALRELDAIDEDEPVAGTKSGLMEMQFMKRAAEREDVQNRTLVDSFKDELQKIGATEEGEDPAPPADTHPSMVRVGGRVYYQPGTQAQPTASRQTEEQPSQEPSPAIFTQENPWLNVDSSASKRSRAKNEVLLSKNSDAATLSKNAMRKQLRKQADAVAQAKDDAALEIDLNATMKLAKVPNSAKQRKPGPATENQTNGHDRVDAAFVDDDPGEDGNLPEASVSRRYRVPAAFEQRELVARAFAGDNVVEEFAAEKSREMEVDAPKAVDTTLPGWGSWGGAGITKPPPKPERIKRFPGVDPKRRQDYGKDHVIISEKKDKKAEKYLVKDLPFPYTSRAQFERRLEVPLGMEWNTRSTFQKGTLPRVVKKMGTVIEPLERLF